jgi:hypothetical protein
MSPGQQADDREADDVGFPDEDASDVLFESVDQVERISPLPIIL